MDEEKKNAASTQPSPKKSIGVMNIILVIVGILLVLFTVKMIIVFETYGAIPDTLCGCVFTALAGECGIMGWIKTTKDKFIDRKWTIEDLERQLAAERERQNKNE